MEFRLTGSAEYVAPFVDSVGNEVSAAETFSPRIVVKRDRDEELLREHRALYAVLRDGNTRSLSAPDRIGLVVVADRSDRLSIASSGPCGGTRLG